MLQGRQGENPDEGAQGHGQRLADPGWLCRNNGGVGMAGNLIGNTALILEYDGAAYAGWQYQINADTVQQQVERACQRLFGVAVSVRGASRTDAGVHARGQVAAIVLPRPFPQEKLPSALNWHLPQDIRVKTTFSVPGNFNPVTWAAGKIYNYYIFQRRQALAIGDKYCWHIPRELDMAAMNSASRFCLGTHDFASFQAAGSSVVDTQRTLRHFFCRRRGNLIIITCIGDGFLYNMVRILVGTLVEVGLGKLPPDMMQSIVSACHRPAAGPTAPARGLFLERVLYRPSLDSYRLL
ncbi:MAG TPA: tRNA pseudouridine(38-40) synthase TruA [Firmicutes bacterium]|nr:tRNA pseudouridine(38-40) synthase TruA [Bacillota bacterium]